MLVLTAARRVWRAPSACRWWKADGAGGAGECVSVEGMRERLDGVIEKEKEGRGECEMILWAGERERGVAEVEELRVRVVRG